MAVRSIRGGLRLSSSSQHVFQTSLVTLEEIEEIYNVEKDVPLSLSTKISNQRKKVKNMVAKFHNFKLCNATEISS